MNFIRVNLIVLSTVLVLVGVSSGQDSAKQVPLIQPARRINNPVNRKMIFIRNLMRQGDYMTAMAMLEEQYETDQENETVLSLLKTCYAELKYYAKSEDIVRRFLEKHPRNLGYQLDLAQLLILQDKKDEARKVYRHAMTLVDKPNRYLFIVNSMADYGFEKEALALIDSVRVEQNQPLLFAMERGGILEKLNKYSEAAREYFPLLADDTSQVAREAERKIFSMLTFADSSPEVEKVLLKMIEQETNLTALKLLTSYYIRSDRLDEAFHFSIKQDSLDKQQGGALLYYVRQCEERKMYDEAARMAEYALAQYPSSPVTLELNFRYAHSLRMLARYQDAIQAYLNIGQISPRKGDVAEALYLAGEIYADNLKDCNSALVYFDSVITHYQQGMGYINSLKSVPACQLTLGQLDKARDGFQKLTKSRLSDDIKEEIDYNLGLIDFYQFQFDSAMTVFRKMVVDYPNGFFINDAIQLLVTIQEASEDTDILKEYAEAQWFLRQNLVDSSLSKLEKIAQSENKILADVALYKLAVVNLAEGDSTASLSNIGQLEETYPDSYYLPFGLKLKADILADKASGKEDARQLYLYLLKGYPNYPFATEVREKVRQMEADVS